MYADKRIVGKGVGRAKGTPVAVPAFRVFLPTSGRTKAGDQIFTMNGSDVPFTLAPKDRKILKDGSPTPSQIIAAKTLNTRRKSRRN